MAMERHDGCRKGGKGYPSRAIRKTNFLYVKNYKPDRWPAGDPDRRVCARNIPYGEVDSAPTKTLLMANANKKTQDCLNKAVPLSRNRLIVIFQLE